MKKFLLASIALVLSLLLHTSSAQGVSQSILNYMATRQMRYHHYMWHQVRENWNFFSNNVRNQFSNIGWAPPNPTVDSRGRRITSNYAGEDFLYMHRQMLGTARSISSFTSWGTIPAPGDRSYPVPPMYGWGNTNSFKTNNYYYGSIQGEEQYLKNPSTLRRMSLNDLGNRIEQGIHQSMHLRWSAYSSYGYRVGGASNGVPNINKQWDNPNYNWLVDTYASQANGWFYKLHGWIDDRVEDWRRANGLSSVRWSGTWTGGPMSNLGSVLNKVGDPAAGMQMQNMNEDPDAVGDVLEKAFEIFAKSGVPEFFIGSRGTTLPPRKRKVVKTCGKSPKKAKKI